MERIGLPDGSDKRFERFNGLNTMLYKNYFFANATHSLELFALCSVNTLWSHSMKTVITTIVIMT